MVLSALVYPSHSRRWKGTEEEVQQWGGRRLLRLLEQLLAEEGLRVGVQEGELLRELPLEPVRELAAGAERGAVPIRREERAYVGSISII